MYYCNNCNKEFDEPQIEKTTYEDFYEVADSFGNKNELNLEKCPYCGNDSFEEMKECDKCGEYCLECHLVDTEETFGVGYVCPDCLMDIKA